MKLLTSMVFFCVMMSSLLASELERSISDLSMGYGSSREDINIYRVSIKKDLNDYIFEKRYKYLPKYYETSFGYWDGKNSGSLKSFSFTPIFRYTFMKKYDIRPYIEAGVGVTYISKKELEKEKFGVHFQFENIIGIGFKLNNFDISYRYMHYSNGGLDDNNSGADFNILSISYPF